MKKLLSNKIAKFLLFAGVLYVSWLLCYYYIIKPYTRWDYYINYNICQLTEGMLSLFGLVTYIDVESDHVVIFLESGNYRGIWVGDECNGFKLFSIFSIFIFSFPGKIKHKLWFLPMGFVFIHLANVIRVGALLLINNYYPQYLDFNHLYTFTIFVYAIIFLLWYWYAKKYSNYEQEA
jgi:exosortase/archaeosortase family protein